jgi:hypothetical protein
MRIRCVDTTHHFEAAAVVFSQPRNVWRDGQRLCPIYLQPQARCHLLEDGPAEEFRIP